MRNFLGIFQIYNFFKSMVKGTRRCLNDDASQVAFSSRYLYVISLVSLKAVTGRSGELGCARREMSRTVQQNWLVFHSERLGHHVQNNYFKRAVRTSRWSISTASTPPQNISNAHHTFLQNFRCATQQSSKCLPAHIPLSGRLIL